MELLVVLGVMGSVLFFINMLENQRREKVTLAARNGGWVPSEGLPYDVAKQLPDSVLFPTHSRSRSIPLTFSIPRVSGAECLFECQYVTGSGKSRHRHKHTALFVPVSESLPQFVLRGENWFDKIAATVGFDDIDLPQFPEFSKKFHLSGEFAEGIRRFFTAELIAKIPPLGRCSITTVAGGVLVRRAESKLKPESLRQQYEELAALARIFVR